MNKKSIQSDEDKKEETNSLFEFNTDEQQKEDILEFNTNDFEQKQYEDVFEFNTSETNINDNDNMLGDEKNTQYNAEFEFNENDIDTKVNDHISENESNIEVYKGVDIYKNEIDDNINNMVNNTILENEDVKADIIEDKVDMSNIAKRPTLEQDDIVNSVSDQVISSNNFGDVNNTPYRSIFNDTSYEIDLDNEFANENIQNSANKDILNKESLDNYADNFMIDVNSGIVDDYIDNNEFEESSECDKNSRRYKRVKRLFITEAFAFVIIAIAIVVVNYMSKMDDVVGNKLDENKLGIEETVRKEGYMTIALFGIDAEDEGTVRSDTIILANINQTTGEIQLVSVYRDTFLYVKEWKDYAAGNDDFTKINAAYVMGVEKAVRALNQNLALHITDYISVDFSTLAKLVDVVGGVEVTIPNTKNFTVYMNKFGGDAAKAEGDNYEKVDESILGKTVILNGYQALGFCRVRKETKSLKYQYPLKGESDYTRSARQKEVIYQIVDKIKVSGVSKVKEIIEVFQGEENVSTSLLWGDILDLAVEGIKYNYHISDKTYNFPYESHTVKVWTDANGNGGKYMEFCNGTLEDDVRKLHADMYPDKTLTEEELVNVKKISQQLDLYKEKYDTGFDANAEE